jgi:hypothetical protein
MLSILDGARPISQTSTPSSHPGISALWFASPTPLTASTAQWLPVAGSFMINLLSTDSPIAPVLVVTGPVALPLDGTFGLEPSAPLTLIQDLVTG